MDLFNIITPMSYWILVLLWTGILVFFLGRLFSRESKSRFLVVLLIILSIDAFRTLFESAYFGLWSTSMVGMLPPSVHEILTRPQYVFIPKFINVLAALVVVFILIKKWLPAETAERREQLARISALEQEMQQRLSAEDAMEQRNQFLVEFMHEAPIPITVHDTDGTLTRANEAWRKMWEIHDLSEVLGRFSILKDRQTQKDGLSAIFQEVVEAKRFGRFDGKYTPMESGMPGITRVVSVSLYPMVVSGEVFRVITISLDLTDEYHRQTEQKRQAHNQGALEMAGAACHELNQPLQVITAQLEMLLEEEQANPQAGRRIATMSGEVKRMADIIRKMEKLTTVETMDYLGDTRIVDIKGSKSGNGDG